MAARSRSAGPQDLTLVVAGLGVAGAVGAAVLGYGGAPLLLAGLVAAGWIAPVPQFTGRKDRAGRPTPAHDGEAAAMRTYRMWTDLRWRALVPNLDWLPGWPVRFAWLAGLVAAAGAAVLPLDPRVPGWGPWVNAACAAVATWQWTGSRRRTAADTDPCPGVRLDGLLSWARSDRRAATWSGGAALAAASLPLAATWLLIPVASFGAAGAGSRWVLAGCVAFAAAASVLWREWSTASLSTWRELVKTRAAWSPRWLAAGAKDESPVLVDHQVVGPLTVDTFDAPPSQGAFAFACETGTARLLPTFGAGVRVWAISCPNTDSMGQPVAGTTNPVRFRVVYCPSDQLPDLADHGTAADVAQLFLECVMATACDLGKVSRYLLVQAAQVAAPPPLVAPGEASEPQAGDGGDEEDDAGLDADLDVTDDQVAVGSPWAVWATTWLNPDGLDGSYLRNQVRGPLAGQVSLPVLVDHRAQGGQGVVYVGPASEPDVVYSPASGVTVSAMEDLEREDQWRERWAAVLKQGVNAPRPELKMFESDDLPTRPPLKVFCQPFVTLTGEDPEGYFGLEGKLKATLQGAPFVAVTGFARNGGRPGERHTQAFAVYWSNSLVPNGPHDLPPTGNPRAKAARWVLAGRMNEAFVAARLPRPEVADAACLTEPRSRGHIWRIGLRLYGGVTLVDVRAAAERIRGTLGSPWLRVQAASDGCTIYAGARPNQVRLANPERDAQQLAALDWEQAWLDSKVSGVGGLLPTLTATGVLPHNEQVQVLDFDLPSGLAVADVRAGIDKLKTATGNGFIEVREGVGGASTIRLLVCESNPLPDRAGFDFAAIDGSKGLPFATGVEGEPVVYDVRRDPHLLVVGGTGSGKSSTLQALLYAALVRGYDIYLADPTKGGADFRFAVPWFRAFTADVFEAAAMMDAVYKEVVRRKELNASHGVGSYTELPEEIRPPHAMVVLDEFTSLLIADALPARPDGDDPDEVAEYDHAVALNAAKRSIGSKAGRIAREARSAGVTLVLATQRLTAKVLEAVPGGQDLRTNMSRLLLGKATFGEMQSALKDAQAAPQVGESVPPGRGIFEVSGERTGLVQSWYTDSIQQVLAGELTARRPPLTDEEKVPLADLLPRRRGAGSERGRDGAAGGDRVIDLGEVELSMADLEEFVDDADELAAPEPAPCRQDAVVFVDVDGTVAPVAAPEGWPDAAVVDSPFGATWISPAMLQAIASLGARVVWASSWQGDAPSVIDGAGHIQSEGALLDEGDERFGWWKIGAVERWLSARPQVRTVVWFDDQLDAEDELGVTHAQTAGDVLGSLGLRHLLLNADPDTGLTKADIERAGAFLDVASAPAVPAEPARDVSTPQTAPLPGDRPAKRRVLTDEW